MKRTGIVLLTVLLLLSSIQICANASDKTKVFVENVIGSVGETVTVDLTLQNNPGMITLRLFLTYDDTALCLLDVEDKGLFGAKNAFFGKDKSENPYTVYWIDALASNNHTDNGSLCTLTFLVLDTAGLGNSEISVTADCSSSLNIDLERISVNTESGFVNIQNKSSAGSQYGTLFMGTKQTVLGETIEMPIYLSENPGIITIMLSVTYDSRTLKLKNVRNGTVFEDTHAHFGYDLTLQPFTLYWENALARKNNNSNGELAILEFEVLQSAPAGEAEIHLEYEPSSTIDMNLVDVPFQADSGTIFIRSSFPGDANESGEIDLQDVVIITRWLAGGWNVTINETNSDVNCDGKINLKDVALIRRFLAGGWGVVLR